MIEIKLYLYDSSQEANGYRGTDLSQYVGQGFSNVEDITQELDTGEIVLYGYPQQAEFAPETKFIVDIYENGLNILDEPLHFIVQKDLVNQPELVDSGYYNHHISLIEPSAVAQKRLVDNISATYKLKDVNLYSPVTYPTTTITYAIDNSYFVPPTYPTRTGTSNHFGVMPAYMQLPAFQVEAERGTIGKYFRVPSGDTFKILNRGGTEYDTIYNNISNFMVSANTYKARFKIPRIEILKGMAGLGEWSDYEDDGIRFVDPMYASLDYKIEEFDPNDLTTVLHSWNGSFISNSRLGHSSAGYSGFNVNFANGFATEILEEEWLLEDIKQPNDKFEFYYKKYTDTTLQSAPTYITQEIDISPDKKYVITVSLHQFNDSLPSTYNNTNRYKHTGSTLLNYWSGVYTTNGTQFASSWDIVANLPTNNRMISSQFGTQVDTVFYSSTQRSIVYQQGLPYTALALMQKAIINSAVYEKESGVYIADVNSSKMPFEIDRAFVDELRTTQVIENFYNQKNLWEILIEVGNYIHAIPEIRFGADNKFLITFSKLGRTDQKTNTNTRISIMNSKGIEDYVSACSSYVTNMVQLGGFIEEWVSPKTTDDNLLVSNDTAEILVSKPIIELISIKVRNNSTLAEADLTPYIYEENVYKTLSLDYKLNPNKGIAMYYSLGSNKITGGNFQLPQANTNMYSDYTIKKCIYCAFMNDYPVITQNIPTTYGWTNLKVNDYSFFVKYRTKDSVRQNHTRPDLRKYLMSSKYDRIPQHNQFNNQQDVLVDSIKFGNNMYGKLIRTGNTNYTITEWSDNYSQLKHKGELYNINGDLYYVAKAHHTFYANHILSEIEYSKDYNQLSQIIGIPSEPRFYEISEQSLIRRDFEINDEIVILKPNSSMSLIDSMATRKQHYLFNTRHLLDLIFGEGTDFAKYVVTVYKGDIDTPAYQQDVGQRTFYQEVFNPINAYSSENTLTYEWDMIDNFSAGDKVVGVDDRTQESGVNPDEQAYTSLKAVGYTDIYGKAPLLDFYIMGDTPNDLTDLQIAAQPESPFNTKEESDGRTFIGDCDILATNVLDYNTDYNSRGLGLLKDCREALSINYNLRLLTNSDTFVVSPFVFAPEKGNVRVVLLANEVNKLSNGYIQASEIITPFKRNGTPYADPYFYLKVTPTTATNRWDITKSVQDWATLDIVDENDDLIINDIDPNHLVGVNNRTQVKAIAIVYDMEDTDEVGKFVIARNIPNGSTLSDAFGSMIFGVPNDNVLYGNRQ